MEEQEIQNRKALVEAWILRRQGKRLSRRQKELIAIDKMAEFRSSH